MADKFINVNQLNEKIKTEQKNNANMGMSVIYDWFIEKIKNEPTADVQPVKRGRWIGVDYDTYFKCSQCKHMTDWQNYKYCPYCGARMDGEQNDKTRNV